MANEADIIQAIIGGGPKDPADQMALAQALRNQNAHARMLIGTGDDAMTALGKNIAGSASADIGDLQQGRQHDIGAAQAASNAFETARHQSAMEGISRDALDPKWLTAEAAMVRAQAAGQPKPPQLAKAEEAQALSQRLIDLADQLDKNPDAVNPMKDAVLDRAGPLRGTLENTMYSPDIQQMRANGKQAFQALQKAMDGIRPNQKMMAQTERWAPFVTGDNAAQVAMKLRNAAEFGQQQANAVISQGSGMSQARTALDPAATYRTAPAPQPLATRARNAIAVGSGAGPVATPYDDEISRLRQQLGIKQ